jgi:hypothetical protein
MLVEQSMDPTDLGHTFSSQTLRLALSTCSFDVPASSSLTSTSMLAMDAGLVVLSPTQRDGHQDDFKQFGVSST